MRDLGESKESCKQNCNNPGPCYPAFNGYQFNLCTSCKNRKPHVANPPGQCAHVWKEHQKRIDECESGCSFYKRKPIMEGLEPCVEKCKETCPDDDLKEGCNMQYSCAHACKMRDLGESEASCKQNCNNP